jgi:hypothetical protein
MAKSVKNRTARKSRKARRNRKTGKRYNKKNIVGGGKAYMGITNEYGGLHRTLDQSVGNVEYDYVERADGKYDVWARW